jgi:tetratricopeptide (TPR) repeat protein
MSTLKSLGLVLLAGTCTGLFLCVQTLPSLPIYDATQSVARLYWLSPPWFRVGWYILAANAVLLGVWIGYTAIVAYFTRQRLFQALHEDALTYLPLCSLAVVLLQFASPLTTRFEGLLLVHEAGYLLVVLALLAIYFLKVENLRRRRPVSTQSPIEKSPAPRPLTWKIKTAVLVLSFGVYAVVGVRMSEQLGLGGDEPHYLVMAHSVWYDHDLKIRNNYNQEDYQEFFPGYLKPHLSIARDGTRYPGHPIALAFLLAPVYALDGYRGALLLMNGFAALLALQIFLLAFALTQRRWLALLLWFVISFTTPLLLYSSQIYPEIPSALLLAIAYRLIRVPSQSFQQPGKLTSSQTWILGGTLALLPWMQQRMILVSVILWAYYLHQSGLIARLRQRRFAHLNRVLTPTLCLAISGLSMALYYYLIYGSPLPNAPYSSVGITSVFSPDIFFKQGLLGLLLDQEGGLLIYSPYYLFMFTGFWLLLRRRWREGVWLLVLVASIYLPCAGFTMKWRGSWSPVARYMVALIPLFTVPLCVCLRQTLTRVFHYVFAFCVIISFTWAALFLWHPFSAIMANDGMNAVLQRHSGLVDITRYFPRFTGLPGDNWAVTGMWLLLIIAFSVGLARSAAGSPGDTRRPPGSRALKSQPGQSVKAVFKMYGLVLPGVLLFAFLVEQVTPQRQSIPQQTQNWRLRRFLQHLDYQTLACQTSFPLAAESLRFTYSSREKHANVNAQGQRFLVTGPREPFPRGIYTALFNLRIEDNLTEQAVATVDVVARRGSQIFQQQTLRGTDFETAGAYELMPLRFVLPRDVDDLETRVFFHNQANLSVNGIYIKPDLFELYYQAGLSALRDGEPVSAKRIFHQAIEVKEHPQIRYQLGILAHNAANWNQAVHHFQQVVATQPEFADAHYRLGLGLQHLGKPEAARQHFERAVHLLPTHLNAWQSLRELYSQLQLHSLQAEAQSRLRRLYAPQHPHRVNFANRLLFLGYSVSNPSPGTLHLEYYWQALTPMTRDYTFFVHFKQAKTVFQHDHNPHIRNPETGDLAMYPTSQWQIGELVHEVFEITAPEGTFTPELGVWEPYHTRQRLPIVSPAAKIPFHQPTTVTLAPLTVR